MDCKNTLMYLAAWEDIIIEHWGNGRYSTYKERMRRTPAGQYKKSGAVKGNWEGDRGESMYSAFDYSDTAIRANQVIYQYGQKGITYSNGEPNFRPVSEAVVSIGDMMGERYGTTGNFRQADIALAEYLNKNPNCELYEKMGVNGTVTFSEIKLFNNAFAITLPDFLVDMPLSIAKIKYPSEQRPQIIKTSMDTTVNFAFNLFNMVTNDEQITDATKQFKNVIARVNPAYVFYHFKIEEEPKK